MKPVILVLVLSCWAWAQPAGTTQLTGAVKYPDGTNVNGTIRVQLSRSTASNTCTTPASTATFATTVIPITNGAIPYPGTNLYASPCLAIGTYSDATIQPGPGAGAGAAATVSGKNYGPVVVTTGSTPQVGTVATIFLKLVSGLTCYVQSNNNAMTAASPYTFTANSSLSIAINATAPLTPNTSYYWYFSCVLAYDVTVQDSANQKLYSGKWSVPVSSFPTDISTVDISQLAK
jgi:hypothetical protein